VRWRLVHAACDNDRSANDFRIEAQRMRTLEQLVYRTLAIAERSWFVHTDWRRLVRRLLKSRGKL
jgi:hypothetical protein